MTISTKTAFPLRLHQGIRSHRRVLRRHPRAARVSPNLRRHGSRSSPRSLTRSSSRLLMSHFITSDGFWHLFSFTVAADGVITLGGQAQTANCQPPRLQDGDTRLADCRSNGCRVEVLSNSHMSLPLLPTPQYHYSFPGAKRRPVGHCLRRWIHRSIINL